MIGNRGRDRTDGKSSFRDCIAYITREKGGEKPLAIWSENVASIETAPFEMEAIAQQSRVQKPLYHLIVSWGPYEQPSYEQVRSALNQQIKSLGFQSLQYIAALHADGQSRMWHLHAAFNRVEPVRYVGRNQWRDQFAIRDACRVTERIDGWRCLAGDTGVKAIGTNALDRYATRGSFRQWITHTIKPKMMEFLESHEQTWRPLLSYLADQKLRYEVMNDFRAKLTGIVSGWTVKLKDLGLKHRDLIESFGPWTGPICKSRQEQNTELVDALGQARIEASDLPANANYADLHGVLARHGVSLDRSQKGMRIISNSGPSWLKILPDDGMFSHRALTHRFGRYVDTAISDQQKHQRHALTIAQSEFVAAQLCTDPAPILETLFTPASVISLETLEAEIARRVLGEKERADVLTASLREMVIISVNGMPMLTTEEILAEERLGLRASRLLAESQMSIKATPKIPTSLSQRYHAAWDYALSPRSRLKVISGLHTGDAVVLANALAESFEAAGCRVKAVGVQSQDIDDLRRSTGISTQSLRDQMESLDQLTANDVIILPNVSILGTQDGSRLLDAAERAGASVIALSESAERVGPSRGDMLRLMRTSLGEHTVSLGTHHRLIPSERLAIPYRRHRVNAALSRVRQSHGLHVENTLVNAKRRLLERAGDLMLAGKDVSIRVCDNQSRIELAAAIRHLQRNAGKLFGPDYLLETIDGKTAFAKNERIVMQESIGILGLHCNDIATIKHIDGSVVTLERGDGALLKLDSHAHPGFRHGTVLIEPENNASGGNLEIVLLTNPDNLIARSIEHANEVFFDLKAYPQGLDSIEQAVTTAEKFLLALDGVYLGHSMSLLDDRGRIRDEFER